MSKINFGYSFQDRNIQPMSDSPNSEYDMFVELNNMENPNKQKELQVFWDRVYSDPFSLNNYNQMVMFHELANGIRSPQDINNAFKQPTIGQGMNAHNAMMERNMNMADYNTRAHNPQLKSDHYKPYQR